MRGEDRRKSPPRAFARGYRARARGIYRKIARLRRTHVAAALRLFTSPGCVAAASSASSRLLYEGFFTLPFRVIHLSACVLYIWERARAGVVIDAECSEMQFHGFCDTQRYDAGRERDDGSDDLFFVVHTRSLRLPIYDVL